MQDKIKVDKDLNKQIRLSVSLSDSSFDSTISLPVDSSQEQRVEFVQAWLGLMDAALRLSKSLPVKGDQNG